MTRVRLDHFDSTTNFQRGRAFWVEAGWYMVKWLFFLSAWPWPSGWKTTLLRWFGAEVGRGIIIRPRVNIHMPWKLKVGDHSWIGEEVFLHSLDQIEIGSHVCISQRAFLCTGNHDYRDVAFSYRNAPITVRDGAWIGAAAFVGPGVVVEEETVLSAGSVATRSLQGGMIYSGNPAEAIRQRWKHEDTGERE